MNRPIEFRAWHLPSLRMLPVIGISETHICCQLSGPSVAIYEAADCVLMQYSGLLDSAGRKVFEGDIVHARYETKEGPVDHYNKIGYYGGAFVVEMAYDDCDALFNSCSVQDGGPCDELIVGNVFESPELVPLLRRSLPDTPDDPPPIAPNEAQTPAGIGLLSRRERELLTLIGAGLTNRQIGDKLFIASSTVSGHKHSIIEKLNLNSTAELARFAVRITEHSNATLTT